MNERAAPFDADASLRLHDAFGAIEEESNRFLDESLGPRGPEMLYDIVEGLGLSAGAKAVDIGCGEGGHSIELARRVGFNVVGVEPLERHLELARAELASAAGSEPGLAARVSFAPGTATKLPAASGSMDLVWCRDVLSLEPDLDGAFSEIRRVLTAEGRAVTYQMFATDRLEPDEAAWLLPTMGCVERSMQPETVETAISTAGLCIEQCHVLGTEWGEFGQERSGRGATKLIRAARLLREPERYIERFGRENYDIALGDNLWHVYRMIGKLSDRVYVLRRADD